jgi:hypothetical protein
MTGDPFGHESKIMPKMRGLPQLVALLGCWMSKLVHPSLASGIEPAEHLASHTKSIVEPPPSREQALQEPSNHEDRASLID